MTQKVRTSEDKATVGVGGSGMGKAIRGVTQAHERKRLTQSERKLGMLTHGPISFLFPCFASAENKRGMILKSCKAYSAEAH